ncbi:hypothetical protein EUGRSUZ_D00353 [Eucalyptus grandis]|uniref:Uncharacterized protein n=2 Tax=Eucalyptus grandis TaxID=71139 RepID=A0ACC3L2Q0_EUCGR|nr:hypothetical protein EUGRSUZ_D00353 [Eucalyptus grandis]
MSCWDSNEIPITVLIPISVMNEKNYDIKCKKTKVTYSRIIFRQSYLKSMENGLTKFRRFIYQNKVQTYQPIMAAE